MEKQRKIIRLISLAARRQMTVFNRNLAEYGTGGGSYVFLVTLVENPDLTQTGLSRKISLDKATAGKALRQLENAGLILRRTNENDRRQSTLEVTEAGMASYRKIIEFSRAYRKAIFADFTTEEQILLEKLLQKHTDAQQTFLLQ